MRRISSSLGWTGEVPQLSIIWESPWISPLHFDPFRMQISRIRVYRTHAGDESGPGPSTLHPLGSAAHVYGNEPSWTMGMCEHKPVTTEK